MRKVLYVLGELVETDIDWLIRNGQKLTLQPGVALITAGHQVDTMSMVISGELSVRLGRKELARLGSGEIVGEMSFLDKRPPQTDVVAEEETLVLGLDHEVMREKLAEDDAFGKRFYLALGIFLAQRLRNSMQGGSGDADPDEDSDNLDNLELAGARFDYLMKRVKNKR